MSNNLSLWWRVWHWSGKYSMDCLHYGSPKELILHYVDHAVLNRGHEAHVHYMCVCMCVSTVKLYMNVYMWSILYRHTWFVCMYVPMHGCTYVCYIHVCAYSYVLVYVCICACMQVSICVRIGVCKYCKIAYKCIYMGYNLWTHMYLSVCIFQWMGTCEFVIFIMHIYIKVGICVHVCVCVCVYT